MAKKTRTELSTLAINTNLPDNTTELITPTTERAQLTDERESVVNYKDDLGGVPNAGKFLTVAVDGESLTMVDEPSGVPDWVTFLDALSNLMKLKSGGNGAQLQFYDADGTTLGGFISWVDGNSRILIGNSQSGEQISLSGNQINLSIGGVPQIQIASNLATFAGAATFSGVVNIPIGAEATPSLIFAGDSDSGMWHPAANTLAFSTFGNERMRITSGGDAIFSGSITAPTLIASGSAVFNGVNRGTDYQYADMTNTSGRMVMGVESSVANNAFGGSTAYSTNFGSATATDVCFVTNNQNRLTISSGGDATFSGGVTATDFGGRAYPYNSILGHGADASTGTIFAGSTAGSVSSINVAGGGATNPNTIILKTASTERMRISSGGNVGIGVQTVFASGLTIEKGGNHLFLRASTATAGKYWNFDVASSNRLYIVDNGNTGVYINDGATSWTANSDESLKENIKPLENVLDKIKDYRCVEYNLKSDDTKGKKIGFIAQDWKDDFLPIVDEDDEGLLGMKYTETIPVLLKAIQEQQTIIDTLIARIDTLENN